MLPRFKLGSGSAGPSELIIALGVFDGVHRGHREIFRQVLRRAQEVRGVGAVYTFDPHPARIVAPHSAPPMINTIEQRVALIQGTGIRTIIVQKFTKEFSYQTPEEFFQKTIVRRLKARELFVGYNFTFGVRRSGTVDRLQELGRKAGIAVHIVPSYLWKGTLVSSTQVRQFLMAGELETAEGLLARPYFLEGKVVRGRGIGGRELQVHTANIEVENDQILPTGVYVTRTQVGARLYRSVTNIGPNPTFGAGPLSVETHLLDRFHRNIIGRRIHVEFYKKIREEIRFATAADLAAQIQKDIQTALKVLAQRK